MIKNNNHFVLNSFKLNNIKLWKILLNYKIVSADSESFYSSVVYHSLQKFRAADESPRAANWINSKHSLSVSFVDKMDGLGRVCVWRQLAR